MSAERSWTGKELRSSSVTSFTPVTKGRYAVLFAGLLLFAAADFVVAPLTDSLSGRGYAHRVTGLDASDPDYGALRGYRRVKFNFRHFFHWWVAWPSGADADPVRLLSSDGNSVFHNLVGHFGGSLAASLLGMLIVPRALLIIALGTLMNVFHEYVAEGRYVDPSFVDLWLDQLGLFLAIAVFVLVVRWKSRREQPAPGAGPPLKI